MMVNDDKIKREVYVSEVEKNPFDSSLSSIICDIITGDPDNCVLGDFVSGIKNKLRDVYDLSKKKDPKLKDKIYGVSKKNGVEEILGNGEPKKEKGLPSEEPEGPYVLKKTEEEKEMEEKIPKITPAIYEALKADEVIDLNLEVLLKETEDKQDKATKEIKEYLNTAGKRVGHYNEEKRYLEKDLKKAKEDGKKSAQKLKEKYPTADIFAKLDEDFGKQIDGIGEKTKALDTTYGNIVKQANENKERYLGELKIDQEALDGETKEIENRIADLSGTENALDKLIQLYSEQEKARENILKAHELETMETAISEIKGKPANLEEIEDTHKEVQNYRESEEKLLVNAENLKEKLIVCYEEVKQIEVK